MDALREIVKAHVKAARAYQETVELERLTGASEKSTRQLAELTTTCEFYEAVRRILEELECE